MNHDDMDPIAFFDHLAATSQSSNEDGDMSPLPQPVKHQQQSKQLVNSRSLETIKPLRKEGHDKQEEEEEEEGEEGEADSVQTEALDEQTFAVRWQHMVYSYRLEREALNQHLRDQLLALQEIEEHFDRANVELHTKIEDSHEQLLKDISSHQHHINVEKRQFEKEQVLVEEVRKSQEEKIKLNVGGQLFETSLITLRKDPNSMLAFMFREDRTIMPDADNSFFIDRDGTYFRLVLNYLRDLRIPSDIVDNPKIMDELMQEARFYKLNDLLRLRWKNLTVVTQQELYQMYPLPTPSTVYWPIVMSLQKKDLSNLDFSGYQIDPRSSFKDSNLENCRFHNAKFGFDFDHQVDFTYTFLLGATFPQEGTVSRASGVKFNMEGAILSDHSEEVSF